MFTHSLGNRAIKIVAQISLCAIVLALLPAPTRADTIVDGTTVRVRSAALQAGWHTGRLTRDARRCAMIQLDQPTDRGHTAVALLVVDALQLGQVGAWTAVNRHQALASEPAHCLAVGAG